MLEEQAPWLSLAVSVLLCLAGAILVDQRANLARWHASTARGFSQLADRPDRHSPRRCSAQSSTCHAAPVHRWHGESRSRRVLMALTILGLNWSRSPWAAAARSSFDQALAAPVSGTQFSAAAATFAQEKRRPYGHIVRDATFEATSEVADCSAQAPGCSPPTRRPQFSGGKAKSIGRSGD